MNDTEVVLYGCGTLRTFRVHWALNELAIPYSAVDSGPQSPFTESAAYRNINATGKIPSVKIGDLYMTESAAICLYLFENFSTAQETIPSYERARLLQWCFFAMSELDAQTLYILAKHAGQLKHLYGESQVAEDVARGGFQTQIAKLEDALEDDRQFIVGRSLTAADLLLATCIESAVNLQLKTPLTVPASCLRYLKRFQQREAFITAKKRNSTGDT